VLGTGIWLGVQHLGYLEFGELRRVAQRTMEQRQIFVNNLAIRRATEELRAARDYNELCRILLAAFGGNDFDGFELSWLALPKESPGVVGLHSALVDGEPCLRWTKHHGLLTPETGAAWSLTLDLATVSNRHRGSMTVYRGYSNRDLQLDINLLTSAFPSALAEALDRTLRLSTAEIMTPRATSEAMAAQAG
jgi:hypothetical protein